MRKVYILEEFITKEELKENHDNICIAYNECLNNDEFDEAQAEILGDMLRTYKKRMDENPEGKWQGAEGKSKLSDFIRLSAITMKQMLDYSSDRKFRVVEAELEDDAWAWVGYKNPVVKEDILNMIKNEMEVI